jgi:4,5-DOPA dioxygenase extradiol
MRRRDFVKGMTLLPMLQPASQLAGLLKISASLRYTDERMPAVFIGHGSPENAFRENAFTKQLGSIGESLPFVPHAVLVISAHYLTGEESLLKVQPHFDNPYYAVKGAVDFQSTITEIKGITADSITDLDHGAWAILRHILPKRNVPVMELSIPMNARLDYHWQLAKQLKQLRDKGVLIIGSGNVVHNLERSMIRMLTPGHRPFSWALETDQWIKTNIDNRNFANLYNYQSMGRAATLAINTADHYIPMLYTLGLSDQKENIVYTYEEVFAGISMRCFKVY